MTEPSVLLTDIADGVATLTLNRPDIHNALNEQLIADLHTAFNRVAEDPEVRVVVLAGAGKSFSAGADLNWMRRMAGFSERENRDDALRLAEMLHSFDTLPKPTVARLHGSVFAGATGLAACADVAIAAEGILFGVTEVRLGLIPATIAPYLHRAIGTRQARRYWLTGERFDAVEALRIGLVHRVVPAADLDAAVTETVAALKAGAPAAIAAAKRLVTRLDNGRVQGGSGDGYDMALRLETAEDIARARASSEGREGVASFLDKRKPDWAGES